MTEHVAVIEPQLAFNPSLSFKRPLLFFDRIYIPKLDRLFENLSNTAAKKDPFPFTQEQFKQSLADLTWLFEQDIVFSDNSDFNDRIKEIHSVISQKYFWDTLNISQSDIGSDHFYNDLSYVEKYKIRINYLLNAEAWILRNKGFEAVPIFAEWYYRKPTPNYDSVLSIVLNSFPSPDDSVPFEEIIQYQKDSSTKKNIRRLRNWMNKAAKGLTSKKELEDEVLTMLDDYETHLKLAKMKYRKGVLEILVTTPLEIAEDLVKFKWSNISKSIFKLKQNKIKLIEEELKAPGREVAHIAHSRSNFTSI